jgi:hypothetical protein
VIAVGLLVGLSLGLVHFIHDIQKGVVTDFQQLATVEEHLGPFKPLCEFSVAGVVLREFW